MGFVIYDLRDGPHQHFRAATMGRNHSFAERRHGDWRSVSPLRRSKGQGFVRHLPKGDLRIAHAFKRGTIPKGPPVPKGRLNPSHTNEIRSRPKTFEGFDRPFGTYQMANLHPAVNCR